VNLREQLNGVALRVAVLKVRMNQLEEQYNAARVQAQKACAVARQASISQVKPRLPSGIEAGRMSINAGQVVIAWDEPVLLAVVEAADPGDIEEYVLPAALRDKRVLDLLREHLPEFTGRRVRKERLDELADEVKTTTGVLLNVATGAKEKVARVDVHDPTGEFSYTPGKPGTAAILAALDAGDVTPDGLVAPARLETAEAAGE
jgi:hypothetical protein